MVYLSDPDSFNDITDADYRKAAMARLASGTVEVETYGAPAGDYATMAVHDGYGNITFNGTWTPE